MTHENNGADGIDGAPARLVSARDVTGRALARLAALAEGVDVLGGTTVTSGITDLDLLTGGFHAGDLVVVGGRPAMGTTSFVLWVLGGAAVTGGRSVALFSLDLDIDQITQRLIAQVALVDGIRLRSGALSPDDWRRARRAAERLAASRLHISAAPDLTLDGMRADIARLRDAGDLDLVVVDDLQRLAENSTREGRSLSAASGELKAIARDFSVPVLCTSQLVRAPDLRADKRPRLADLRGSSRVEQDADAVVLIYRDDHYHPRTSEDRGLAELIVCANRRGPTDTITCVFRSMYMSFDNLAR